MERFTEPVEELLQVARIMREEHPVYAPTITWQPEEGTPLVAQLTGLTGDTRSDLDRAFTQLREMAGAPVWFAVTLDSYARTGPPDEVDALSLEEAFIAGDMKVIEQMVTIFMDPNNGELVMIRQVYRYLPSEGWEWSKPEVVETPDDAVTTAVRTFQ